MNETARLGASCSPSWSWPASTRHHEVIDIDVAATVAERRGRRLQSSRTSGSTSTSAPGILAVPGAVEQILDNLVSNALDAAPSGSTVRIEAHGDDGGVDIHVVDQGPGMTEDQRRHVFERFWRPPRRDRYKDSASALRMVAPDSPRRRAVSLASTRGLGASAPTSSCTSHT